MYERHPIELIEGIGDALGAGLRAVGITATEDLLEWPEVKLYAAVDKIAHFPTSRLADFCRAAALLQIDGVDEQVAEGLLEPGHRTHLLALGNANPDDLKARLDQARAERRIRAMPTDEQIVRIQKRAMVLALTGKLAGVVTDASGRPLEGAEVVLTSPDITESAATDGQGKFWCPVVPPGTANVIIRSEAHQSFRSKVSVPSGVVRRMRLSLKDGSDPVAVADEAAGAIIQFNPGDTMEVVATDHSAVAEAALFVLHDMYANGDVKLLGADRRRVGSKVSVPRVRLAPAQIRGGIERGALYRNTGGTFVREDRTFDEYRRSRLPGALQIDMSRLVIREGR